MCYPFQAIKTILFVVHHSTILSYIRFRRITTLPYCTDCKYFVTQNVRALVRVIVTSSLMSAVASSAVRQHVSRMCQASVITILQRLLTVWLDWLTATSNAHTQTRRHEHVCALYLFENTDSNNFRYLVFLPSR